MSVQPLTFGLIITIFILYLLFRCMFYSFSVSKCVHNQHLVLFGTFSNLLQLVHAVLCCAVAFPLTDRSGLGKSAYGCV